MTITAEIKALLPKATITEFDENKKYLIIFERSLSPDTMVMIRQAIDAKGISACVLCGVQVPRVFEMNK